MPIFAMGLAGQAVTVPAIDYCWRGDSKTLFLSALLLTEKYV